MTHSYTLYNEQTAKLTARGYTELRKSISEAVIACDVVHNPDGIVECQITDGRQTVECQIRYLLLSGFIHIDLEAIVGFTMDSQYELVCDMPLELPNELEWDAAKYTTEQYNLISVVE